MSVEYSLASCADCDDCMDAGIMVIYTCSDCNEVLCWECYDDGNKCISCVSERGL